MNVQGVDYASRTFGRMRARKRFEQLAHRAGWAFLLLYLILWGAA